MNVLADFAAYDALADARSQIRARMEAEGFSVGSLAGRIGLSIRQTRRILNGVSSPASVVHLAAIARALGAELKVELVSQRLRAAKR